MKDGASPTVTIVTAAYQSESHLPETIDSVLSQTFDDWEWRIVDDGSTDRTADVARSTGDPRISVQSIAHTGLPAVARNVAIEQAQAQYVAILDADDIWDPRKLELQVAVLDRHPDVGLVHTAADRLVDGQRIPRPYAAAPSPADLVRDNSIPSDSVLLRRELLVTYGAFDPDPELWGSADYELWLRLLPRTRFAFIAEPLLLYRAHGMQMSVQRERMHRGALTALLKTRALNPQLDAVFARSIGIRRCLVGERARARRDLSDALRQNPRDTLAWSWLVRAIVGPATVRRLGTLLGRQRGTSSA